MLMNLTTNTHTFSSLWHSIIKLMVFAYFLDPPGPSRPTGFFKVLSNLIIQIHQIHQIWSTRYDPTISTLFDKKKCIFATLWNSMITLTVLWDKASCLDDEASCLDEAMEDEMSCCLLAAVEDMAWRLEAVLISEAARALRLAISDER